MRVNRSFFRYFAYSLEILIFYVLQGTPNLVPDILGSKPLFLIPIALTIAARERVVPSLVFGAVCGVLTDISSGSSVGFFAIMITLVCFAEVSIYENYLVPSFLTVGIISVVSVPCIIGIYFLFFRFFAGIDDCGYLFVHHYISRIVYTLVMTVPFYYLNRFLYRLLN